VKNRVIIPLIPDTPNTPSNPNVVAVARETMEGLDRDECLDAAAQFEAIAKLIRQSVLGGPHPNFFN
jgi:hypothetical protein